MSPSKRRVLVVDDDADIRRLASLSLEKVGGHEARTASSGEEAVRTATSWQPDVIVLDFRMPGMDGPATLERLRQSVVTRDIPVVFLTASVHRSALVALTELWPAGVLEKPFDPMSLSDELAELLDW